VRSYEKKYAENREGAKKLLERLRVVEKQWRDMSKVKSLDESAKVAYADCADTVKDIVRLSAWTGEVAREEW
jgi:hypothetical protein